MPMQCWHGSCQERGQLCNNDVSERLCNAAETSATGAMTPARGGQRCQRASIAWTNKAIYSGRRLVYLPRPTYMAL